MCVSMCEKKELAHKLIIYGLAVKWFHHFMYAKKNQIKTKQMVIISIAVLLVQHLLSCYEL